MHGCAACRARARSPDRLQNAKRDGAREAPPRSKSQPDPTGTTPLQSSILTTYQPTPCADALAMAARGFRVFPLAPNSKVPACDGWQRMATTDPARIAGWWSDSGTLIGFTRDGREVMANPSFNYGVATGGGLLVVDIDVKDHRPGPASIKALGIDRIDGLVVQTPTKGLHWYCQGPDVLNSVGALGEAVDIRSAGGYVVGPGSTIDGESYVLVKDGAPVEAPAIIVHRCVGASDQRRNADPVVELDTPAAVSRGTEYLAMQAPLAVEGQGGDHTTFVVAATLKDFGVSEDRAADLLAEHWNDRCSPPWAPDDLRIKVRNAYEYGTRPPGDLSPAADFAGVVPPPDPTPATEPTGWVWASDVMARESNVRWRVRHWLATTGVALFVGPAKSGKTFALIDLVAAITEGQSSLGGQPRGEALGALLIAAEGAGTLPQRLKAVAKTRQLGELPGLIIMPSANGLRDQEAWLRAQVASAADALSARGRILAVIVLDAIASGMGIEDENDAGQVTKAVQIWERIARDFSLLVILVHHTGKHGDGPRGSSAFTAAVDTVLRVERDPMDASLRVVEIAASRNGPEGLTHTFRLTPIRLGLDDDGEPIDCPAAIWEADSTAPGAPMNEAACRVLETLQGEIEVRGAHVAGRVAIPLAHLVEALADHFPQDTRDTIRHRIDRVAKQHPQMIEKFQVARKRYVSVKRAFSGADPQADFAGINVQGLN